MSAARRGKRALAAMLSPDEVPNATLIDPLRFELDAPEALERRDKPVRG